MNNWIEVTSQLPNEGESVVAMVKDADGCSHVEDVIYSGGQWFSGETVVSVERWIRE